MVNQLILNNVKSAVVSGLMKRSYIEQKSQDCPECRQREFKIVDLEHELSRAHKTNAALQEQINTNSDKPIEIPDLKTFIQHCESGECASHKRQWDEMKALIRG